MFETVLTSIEIFFLILAATLILISLLALLQYIDEKWDSYKIQKIISSVNEETGKEKEKLDLKKCEPEAHSYINRSDKEGNFWQVCKLCGYYNGEVK